MEKIRAHDKESYEALRESMFLDPRKLDVSLKGLKEKAKSFEIQGKTWKQVHDPLMQEDPAWFQSINLLLDISQKPRQAQEYLLRTCCS